MSQKIIIANWKANPDSPGRAVRLAKEIERGAAKSKKVEVVIAPPAPYILSVRSVIKKTKLAAQNVFWEGLGAYTGEISWRQLKHCKVNYVIVGHSERRRLLGETDEMINKKVIACLKNGLSIVLCIGEPKSVRSKGMLAVKKFLSSQLSKDLQGTKPLVASHKLLASLVIAYEPIWAIGTGKADNPEETALLISFIKTLVASGYSLTPRVLYGGSINAKNAKSFLSHKEIDGALVGGASLHLQEFLKIVQAAE